MFAASLNERLWSRGDVTRGSMCAETPKPVAEGRRLSPATPPKCFERRSEPSPHASGKRRANDLAAPRIAKMSKTTAQVGGTSLSASEFPETSITSLYIIAEYVRLAADVTDADVYVGSEYAITVDRSRGDMLGLHVEADSETLLVEHVSPGLVHIWNELAAQMELDGRGRVADVRPGDCLVEVNGMRSVSGMVAELRKHHVLVMKFRVGEDPVLAMNLKDREDERSCAGPEGAPAACNGCGRSDCATCEQLWEALCSECWSTPH